MKLVKKLFFIFLIAAIAVIVAGFARKNNTDVSFDLLFTSVNSIQLWLLALLCFLAGMIFSVITVFFDLIFAARTEKQLKKEIAKLKSEIAALHSEKLADIDPKTLTENSTSAETANNTNNK